MVQNKAVDTIVAEATPIGRGGVGVVRISGPKVFDIAVAVLKKSPRVRYAEYLPFWDQQGRILDKGIALLFKGPHSFTGEDVLELQGHGGPVIVSCLLREIVNLGARIARPGEFTERAFLNDKLDLLQAEAVADLINASSEAAARAALRTLEGKFSNQVETLLTAVIQLRMYVEAAIDFPEEEIDFLNDGHIALQLQNLITQVEKTLQASKEGVLLSNGVKVVIIGKPNAGKSSLLNALAGRDAAIVTDIPGTTRDVLRQSIILGEGLLVELVDTAGFREGGDVVEQEGIRRALKEVESADHLVFVLDGSETQVTDPFYHFPDFKEKIKKEVLVTVLLNKIDKFGAAPKKVCEDTHTVIYASVKEGLGLPLFREHLQQVVGFSGVGEGNFIARRRHVDALERVNQHLRAGEIQLRASASGELLAEELRLAQLSLDEITGKFTSDDLLGRIFSEFCIGK
jgi:tRNA modification GTPase